MKEGDVNDRPSRGKAMMGVADARVQTDRVKGRFGLGRGVLKAR
jgi:hypothetical protein